MSTPASGIARQPARGPGGRGHTQQRRSARTSLSRTGGPAAAVPGACNRGRCAATERAERLGRRRGGGRSAPAGHRHNGLGRCRSDRALGFRRPWRGRPSGADRRGSGHPALGSDGASLADALGAAPTLLRRSVRRDYPAGDRAARCTRCWSGWLIPGRKSRGLRSQVQSATDSIAVLMAIVATIAYDPTRIRDPRFAASCPTCGASSVSTRMLMTASVVVTKGWWAGCCSRGGRVRESHGALPAGSAGQPMDAVRLGLRGFGSFERKYLTRASCGPWDCCCGAASRSCRRSASLARRHPTDVSGRHRSRPQPCDRGRHARPALSGTLPPLAVQIDRR